MAQLQLFQEDVMARESLDIRTEKQKNNQVSYDVGEKIGGAKKDLVHNRKSFLMKPSLSLLQQLEDQDKGVAAEVIQRDTFFSWFSLEDCRERAVAPEIAKALQLFIRRIPKSSADNAAARRLYTQQMMLLSDLLRTVTTRDEYLAMERRIMHLMSLEQMSITSKESGLEARIEMLSYEDDPELINYHSKEIQKKRADIACYQIARDLAFTKLGGTFNTYFFRSKSRHSLLQNAFAVKGWEELLQPAVKEKDGQVTGRKAVWKRELPDSPQRAGGQIVQIDNPEDFLHHFGFRASEFGHYLGDAKGKSHLLQSAQGFTDLSTLLGISTQAVSLDGKLAMAFGSRGSGTALGHYEPHSRVINLTKNKGSLGVLAHEWFHALDHHLYSLGHAYENGKVGYLSQTPDYSLDLPTAVIDAMNELLQVMTEGKTTTHFNVQNTSRLYTISSSFERHYHRCDGDLQEFMDDMIDSFDQQASNALVWVPRTRLEKEKARIARRRKTYIRTHAEGLAQLHEKVTGNRVNLIPYTSDRTAYLEAAISLDKGNIGKYWSAPQELIARAFETFITERLQERNWRNDYLVCGIGGEVYPLDEEKEKITQAMAKLIAEVTKLL